MMKTLMAVLACAALAAPAAAVDFDRGVDTKSFTEKAAALELPSARPVPGYSHYTRDCARFSFAPAEGDVLGPKAWLRSTEYVRECRTEYVRECYTTYKPGPNNTQIPVQTCYLRPYERCWDRPGMSWQQSAQVKVLARRLLPWETESFEACLEGPWMNLYTREAAYKYDVRRQGSYDSLFELAPLHKVPTAPDGNGLSYGDFSYADGKFTFKVNDRWVKEYAGEKVAVKIDLYSEGWWVFNGYKGSREFTFDAAEGYTMTFSEKDLEADSDKELDRSSPDRGAKKYFLKWGFRRLGAVSKNDFVKKDKTPSIAK
jgi:hypothetical protein